jgi:PTH1 family peptidyl-tRNA hydrolase
VKLIVGLGNPGRAYIDSRHNIGFSVVKALGRNYKVALKSDHAFSLSGKGKIEGNSVIFALPLTFMNLSGIAVSALIKRYRIEPEDLLVICDDLDLEFGSVRIRPDGSSGGHKGLESIIRSLGSQDFARLRLGIGRPPRKGAGDTSDFVLSHFSKKEKEALKETIAEACSCCKVWAKKGVTESMNIFNRRNKKD